MAFSHRLDSIIPDVFCSPVDSVTPLGQTEPAGLSTELGGSTARPCPFPPLRGRALPLTPGARRLRARPPAPPRPNADWLASATWAAGGRARARGEPGPAGAAAARAEVRGGGARAAALPPQWEPGRGGSGSSGAGGRSRDGSRPGAAVRSRALAPRWERAATSGSTPTPGLWGPPPARPRARGEGRREPPGPGRSLGTWLSPPCSAEREAGKVAPAVRGSPSAGCVGRGEPGGSSPGLPRPWQSPGAGRGQSGGRRCPPGLRGGRSGNREAPLGIRPLLRLPAPLGWGGAGHRWGSCPTSGTRGRERARRSWPWASVRAALPSLGALG